MSSRSRSTSARPRPASRYGIQLSNQLKQYVILEQQVTPDQSLTVAEAHASGRLPAIALQPTQVRSYPIAGAEPDTSLANQLLGFVDAEGHGNKGIEQAHDARLTGVEPPGQQPVAALAGADPLGTAGSAGPPPMRLTLDADLQMQLETELLAARIANGSKSVSGIVMDADTGADPRLGDGARLRRQRLSPGRGTRPREAAGSASRPTPTHRARS